MAPEQFESAKTANKQADVYALGKIFAHLISGNEPEALKVSLAGVPDEFRFFVSKCCRDDPDRRFPDGTAALDSFRRFLVPSEVQLPPVELLRQLEQEVEEALGSDGELDALERLDAHVRGFPDDAEMNTRVVPRLSHDVIHAWITQLPNGFREAIRAYDVHISESGTLNFDYCDVIADFYIFLYGITDDMELKALIWARLVDLGYSHNRFYVGEVLVDLLAAVTNVSDAALAAEAIEENPKAAAWYAEALKRPLMKPIADALQAAVDSNLADIP